MNWRFILHLKGIDEMTVDLSNRLFEAGCDDGNPSGSGGRARIRFNREAEVLSDSIRSAVADVQKAGVEVDRVEIENADLAETELAHWAGSAP